MERYGNNDATEAEACVKIKERLVSSDRCEVRAGARGQRADLLVRFKKDYCFDIWYEIQVKSCKTRGSNGKAQFSHVNKGYKCPVICLMHNPPSLWIFRGEYLEETLPGGQLQIGKSPRKKEYITARIDDDPDELYKRLFHMINMIVNGKAYTPETLAEHALHMSTEHYVNYHARTLFSQLHGRETFDRAVGEIENKTFSHEDGVKKVRESVARVDVYSAGFKVNLHKNGGMTDKKKTNIALEQGDFDILRVFLLARRRTSSDASASDDSPLPWLFERSSNDTNERIEKDVKLLGYWEISADELIARKVLGKRLNIMVYPTEDFCKRTGWRKPTRISASHWTRMFFEKCDVVD